MDLVEQQIGDNAQAVIEHLGKQLGVTLAYDEPSVEWLDDYIERIREHLDRDVVASLIDGFGSFLGECIRRGLGGKWELMEGRWGIRFDEGMTTFPLTWVEKQFSDGHEAGESIASKYQTIATILANPAVFNLHAAPRRTNAEDDPEQPAGSG